VTPAGADHCQLAVRWSPGLAYPVLVDPQWVSTTTSMLTARSGHTATPLTPGDPLSRVLICGGFDSASPIASAIATAELYHPLSRSFAATGSMLSARGYHTATALGSMAAGGGERLVLVIGGATRDSLDFIEATSINTLEFYDPASGQFYSDDSALAEGVFHHTATLIDTDLVLIVGGYQGSQNQPTIDAFEYSFTSVNDTTITQVGDLADEGRAQHTATLLDTGEVLIAGGFSLSGTATNTAQVYDASNDVFVPINSIGTNTKTRLSLARGAHTATRLSDGRVVLAGGKSEVGTSGAYTNTFDIYLDGTGSEQGFRLVVPFGLAAARANHAAVLLPGDRVLLAGGANGTTPVLASEIWTSTASSAGPSLASGRIDAPVTVVNSGGSITAGVAALITGGYTSVSSPLATAEVLITDNGDACTSDVECGSGLCVESVCCDARCDGPCMSCTAAGKGGGSDGTCGPRPMDTAVATTCVGDIQVSTVCDGAGAVVAGAAIDCKPGSCQGSACVAGPDAGASQPDAGTSQPDAGTSQPDAGGDQSDDGGGCCQSSGGTSSGWLWLLVAIAVLRRRRR
jgi:uncharacterized protein (TIGR03382 family)